MGKAAIGDLEQLLLLAVVRLGDAAYAVSIREQLARRAARNVSRGAAYVTLERLERKGYLESSFGEPTAARGGKAKKFYRVTAEGLAVLRETQAALQAMWDDIDLAGEERG